MRVGLTGEPDEGAALLAHVLEARELPRLGHRERLERRVLERGPAYPHVAVVDVHARRTGLVRLLGDGACELGVLEVAGEAHDDARPHGGTDVHGELGVTGQAGDGVHPRTVTRGLDSVIGVPLPGSEHLQRPVSS